MHGKSFTTIVSYSVAFKDKGYETIFQAAHNKLSKIPPKQTFMQGTRKEQRA